MIRKSRPRWCQKSRHDKASFYLALHLADALGAENAMVARLSEGSSKFPDTTNLRNTTLEYKTSGTYENRDRIISLQNDITFQMVTQDAVYGEPSSYDLDPADDEYVNTRDVEERIGDGGSVRYVRVHSHTERRQERVAFSPSRQPPAVPECHVVNACSSSALRFTT